MVFTFSTPDREEYEMKRKATYRLTTVRRESLHVYDEHDHVLMLVEMEGVPVEYQVGAAGEFVSRRSVTYHERIGGAGTMTGYATTHFREGSLCSLYEGTRDAETKTSTGTWKVYKASGKLSGLTGGGVFTVRTTDVPGENIMEIDGEYELPSA